MEKDNELKGNGNSYDFGARIYDPRLGRWLASDPHSEKYPYASSYCFALNTPIQAKDPDGKDVYIIIWYTADGQVGHAGIAVDNYKTEEYKVVENGVEVSKVRSVKDGTVSYYDFWPKNVYRKESTTKKDFEADRTGLITKKTLNKEKLLKGKIDPTSDNTVDYQEQSVPEGIIQLKTSEDKDMQIKTDINTLYNAQGAGSPQQYNAITKQCTDFVITEVKKIDKFSDLNASENIKADNLVLRVFGYEGGKVDYNINTPNFLFKSLESKVKADPKLGSVIYKDDKSANENFIEGKTDGMISDETPGR